MRETRVIRLGGTIVAAAFAPRGDAAPRREQQRHGSGSTTLGPAHSAAPRLGNRRLTAAVWAPTAASSPPGRRQATSSGVRRTPPAHELHRARRSRPSPSNGRRSSSRSGTHVRLVDLATREKVIVLPGRDRRPRRLDPNGQGLRGRVPRTARARPPNDRDARTGHLIRRLPETGIRSFAFSPNGKLLASGSYDRTARIWNARTGRLLHVLPHEGYVLRRELLPRRQVPRHVELRRRRRTSGTSPPGSASFSSSTRRARSTRPRSAPTAARSRLRRPTASAGSTTPNGRLLASLAGPRTRSRASASTASGRTLVTGSTRRNGAALGRPARGDADDDRQRTPARASLFLGPRTAVVDGRPATARILTTSGQLLTHVDDAAPIVASGDRRHHDRAPRRPGGDVADLDSGTAARPSTDGSDVTAIAVRAGRDAARRRGRGTVRSESRRDEPCNPPRRPGPVLGLARAAAASSSAPRTSARLHRRGHARQHDPRRDRPRQPLPRRPRRRDGEGRRRAALGRVDRPAPPHAERPLVGDHRRRSTRRTASTSSPSATTTPASIWSTRPAASPVLIGHFFPVYSGSYSPDGHWIVTASQFTAGLWDAATGQLMFYLGRDTSR